MPTAMLLWRQVPWPRRTHLLAECAECKLHLALRDINPHCSRKLRPRKVAPFPENYPAVGARAYDNSDTVAYWIPSRPQVVDYEAVRQSIHGREGAYPADHDYADLRQRGVLLLLIWKESSAISWGLTLSMIL